MYSVAEPHRAGGRLAGEGLALRTRSRRRWPHVELAEQPARRAWRCHADERLRWHYAPAAALGVAPTHRFTNETSSAPRIETRTVAREALFSFGDDATVVGAGFAVQPCMAEKTIEERLSALEAQLENRTIGELSGTGRLIDRLFVYRFEGLDKKLMRTRRQAIEPREQLDEARPLGESLESRVDVRIEAKVKPIKADLAIIKHAVGVLLTRLT